MGAYLCLPALFRQELQFYLKKSSSVSSSTMNVQEDYKFSSSLRFQVTYRQELQSSLKEHLPLTPSFTNLKAQLIATYLHLTTTFKELPIDAFFHLPAPFRQELQSTLKKSSPVSSSTTNSQETYKFSSSLSFPAPHRQELQSFFKERLPLTPSLTNLEAKPIATNLCLTTTFKELPIAVFLRLPDPFRQEL